MRHICSSRKGLKKVAHKRKVDVYSWRGNRKLYYDEIPCHSYRNRANRASWKLYRCTVRYYNRKTCRDETSCAFTLNNYPVQSSYFPTGYFLRQGKHCHFRLARRRNKRKCKRRCFCFLSITHIRIAIDSFLKKRGKSIYYIENFKIRPFTLCKVNGNGQPAGASFFKLYFHCLRIDKT